MKTPKKKPIGAPGEEAQRATNERQAAEAAALSTIASALLLATAMGPAHAAQQAGALKAAGDMPEDDAAARAAHGSDGPAGAAVGALAEDAGQGPTLPGEIVGRVSAAGGAAEGGVGGAYTPPATHDTSGGAQGADVALAASGGGGGGSGGIHALAQAEAGGDSAGQPTPDGGAPGLGGTLPGAVDDAVSGGVDTVGGLVGTVTGTLLPPMVDLVNGTTHVLTSTVTDLLGTTTHALGQTVSGTLEGVTDLLGSVTGTLGHALGDTGGGLGQTVSGTLDGVTGAVSDTLGAVGSVTQALGDVVGGTTHALGDTLDGALSAVGSLLTGITGHGAEAGNPIELDSGPSPLAALATLPASLLGGPDGPSNLLEHVFEGHGILTLGEGADGGMAFSGGLDFGALNLGFLGQSTLSGADAHDASTVGFGSTLHGFV
ncbi:hypothetical protein ACLBXM_09725 [Xanthobacteraceae bacterium A53D]